jgi:hypothetical protein
MQYVRKHEFRADHAVDHAVMAISRKTRAGIDLSRPAITLRVA